MEGGWDDFGQKVRRLQMLKARPILASKGLDSVDMIMNTARELCLDTQVPEKHGSIFQEHWRFGLNPPSRAFPLGAAGRPDRPHP